jgi:hypothetical protein
MTEKSKRDKCFHQIWVRNETYDELEKIRLRDESINSIVGFLCEFYKAHKDDLGISRNRW